MAEPRIDWKKKYLEENKLRRYISKKICDEIRKNSFKDKYGIMCITEDTLKHIEEGYRFE